MAHSSVPIELNLVANAGIRFAVTIATCTAASLSAAPPSGVTDPNWWQTYVFSDNFHGTPKTNQLMGEVALSLMTARGWR